MVLKHDLVQTALLVMHHSLAHTLQHVMSDLTDVQLQFCAPEIDERCIRDVAVHAQRPVLAATAIVAGHDWPPRPRSPTSHDELLELLEAMTVQIDQWLTETGTEELSRTVTLRWGDFPTGTEAIVNSLSHGLVHIGAIQGIRALGGFPLPPEQG